MTRIIRAVALVLAIAAVVATAAFGARPKPSSAYNDVGTGVSIEVGSNGKIVTFSGSCPGGSNGKYLFVTQDTVKVTKAGKFHYDKKIRVANRQGKTLAKKQRLTFDGQFTSKRKAKGSYKLHTGSCKKTKFTAVLQ